VTKREEWFHRGHEAFAATFPGDAGKVPFAPFYVCPICWTAFSLGALAAGELTLEHVPPESVGGDELALTCRTCNNDAGAKSDSHMRREADVYDFFARGTVRDLKVDLRISPDIRLPGRVSVSGNSMTFFGKPKAARRGTDKRLEAHMKRVVVGDGWKDFTFHMDFPSYSPKAAAASWLRSAYLAFFAALGYHFIVRSELDLVRHRIRNPEHDEPTHFRMYLPEALKPGLAYVDSPDVFRSYMLLYKHNAVLLPCYNDHDLYRRLAATPDGAVVWSGKEYPWPERGPTFVHDLDPPPA
jgi:hypothetical protein